MVTATLPPPPVPGLMPLPPPSLVVTPPTHSPVTKETAMFLTLRYRETARPPAPGGPRAGKSRSDFGFTFAPLPPAKMSALGIGGPAQELVNGFKRDLGTQAEALLADFFPRKLLELDTLLKEEELNIPDPASIHSELDIPIPDPAKDKLKEEEKKKKKAAEKKDKEEKGKDEKEDKDDEDSGPPCGPVSSNERIVALLGRVKPEIALLKEKSNVVSIWLQVQIPKIEDGNNFGVQVQEKVFEGMTGCRTKIEGFQTQITKYFQERGDAVAKAAKEQHVGDYRQLVHQIDEAQYSEIRAMVMEIRNQYALLYDLISKNFDKIKKPRGDSKALIY